ncbi:hypothetical protein JFU47_32115 [Pseudomonas sp. TH39(2020)]|uniref:hypothetical protein n=1 Tax=Pseudomonas sp. TH39(2020) TaxID=2796349 RepID=UPI001912ECDA|nr:hypothetical protein [Pseudomonas sp. TH39(2020)]MBK5401323.1 hypothetical protein [Pseudomonas sp. TH39(2020)]
MTLLTALLNAVQTLPNAAYITQQIKAHTMSLSQKVIAAMYQITNAERFGFYMAEEHVLIEKIIETAELPFTGECATEVKSRLHGVTNAINKLGIEVTKNGDFLTVWGPGVKK